MLNPQIKDAQPGIAYAVPMATIETMGDRIRVLRQARGLTQPQLASEVGVTKSAVSQWEDGSVANIRLQTFLRLVEVLRTDYEYLIFGPDRNQAQRQQKPKQT